MPKFASKTNYTPAGGYPGALAKTHRGSLWDTLNAAGVLTDVNRATITATSTLLTTQCGLLMGNVAGASIVSTLPVSGAATDDAVYLLKRLDTSANTWTVAAGAANTIEGQASIVVPPGGIVAMQLPAGSTDWKVIGAAGNQPVLTTGGTATAYTITPPVPWTAYAANLRIPQVKFHAASGANPTAAVSGLATPPQLVKQLGDGTFANIAAGEIPANHISDLMMVGAAQLWVMTLPALANGSVTAAKLDGAQSGSAPIYGARSWGNFNGQGTIAIRASGNCSSITDTGAGTYRVNFATLMPDANYAALVWWTNAADGNFMKGNSADYTATGFAMEYTNTSGTGAADPLNVTFAVFR